ncbi:MAG: dihydrolipoyl dehydrogenase, partial [Spirochaetes bacterium]
VEQDALFDNLRFDLAAVMKRKNEIVQGRVKGLGILMKGNGIETIHGTARLEAGGGVSVTGGDGTRTLEAKSVILATGSVPATLPAVPFDGARIVSSTEALSFNDVPESLVVIGAGAVGLEIGSIWMRLGSRVTVVELADQVLPGADVQMARSLMQSLKRQGMGFFLSSRIQGMETRDGEAELSGTDAKGNALVLRGSRVLVAVGRKAFLDGLGIEARGIALTEKGAVKVNAHFQTSDPRVYAIGDIVEGPMLAHKAEDEGIAVAEIIAGKPGHVNYATIPGVVYTWPEAAWVGMTEAACAAQNIPCKTGSFYFKANARAVTAGSTDGFVKIVAHAHTDRLLGASILGPWASDLIAEAVTVMEFGGSAEDIARTMHAHPTLAEAVKEAAMDVEGRSINGAPRTGIQGKKG